MMGAALQWIHMHAPMAILRSSAEWFTEQAKKLVPTAREKKGKDRNTKNKSQTKEKKKLFEVQSRLIKNENMINSK